MPRMKVVRSVACCVLGALIAAPALMGKVYIRWTLNDVPKRQILGVSELVIPWSAAAQTLAAAAEKQGYRVYWEATLAESGTAAEAGNNSGVEGIILKGDVTEEAQLQARVADLRHKYPKMKILALSGGGKQPQMRGWLVFQRNGILQVSSPSSQPWLDQNLAVIRYQRAFAPNQAPLYTFAWDASDPIFKQYGPTPVDYSLAIAEAGAFHADLVLELHERQEKDLLRGDTQALAAWEPVKRSIAFYQGSGGGEESSAVGILTGDYDTSYEATNLMARHNIPFRVLKSEGARGQDLAGFSVVVAFATLTKEQVEAIRAYAERGGTAVLVNLPGTYPWYSASPAKKSEHSTTYSAGKGRVIELDEPVGDPETFAQDIRRLMTKQQIPVSLWNSLTTLVAEYPGEKADSATVELVNYSEEPTQVQVQLRGAFASLRYESPELGCCQELKPSHVDGFTEFVVPNVITGGRVHLQAHGEHAPK